MPTPTGYSPSVNIPLSGAYFIDALLGGTAWAPPQAGASVNLTYSFISNQSSFAPAYSESGENLSPYALTVNQQAAVNSVLASWSAVANIKFTLVNETADSVGDLRFGGYSGMDEDTLAWAYYPDATAAAGDVWIGPATNEAQPVKGSYDYLTLLHEIGHALGLKHGFEAQPNNSQTLPLAADDVYFTVMSYTDYYSVLPSTPMLLDILAIQYLYGANTDWQSGNTTYSWAPNKPIFETIWDGGGIDTIDASNQLAAVDIDLNEGAYSEIGKPFTDYQNNDYSFNAGLAIAFGAKIENAVGSTYNDKLTGNDLANVLDGRAGRDRMEGGLGDDSYVVDNLLDSVWEYSGGGNDTVISSVNWALGSNLENLILTGSALTGTGNALVNNITGNALANALDGGAGADTLIGGAGNDTYIVDNSGDVVTELANEGIDTVKASIDYSLGVNLENLTLTGTANLYGIGNELNNTLTGNSGSNHLDGGIGSDTLIGGLGNDIYYVDNSGDIVSELANQGTDSVFSTVSWTLGANLEGLFLKGSASINGTGNKLANSLFGNDADNRLDGKLGADHMAGGKGNDTYLVDNASDLTIEQFDEGTDTVSSTINWTLGANLENLILTGSALSGTGNALVNSITGNTLANTLDGGAGADTLIGGAGNDTYIVDNSSDMVIEQASEGIDTIKASLSYSLANQVENLILTGNDDIDGTGNALANSITGNGGANILDGGSGIDTLAGGAGNDTYIVDLVQRGTGSSATVALEDNIVETAGSDTLRMRGINTDAAYTTLALATGLENLDASATGGTRLNLTGNTVANVITGNTADNRLDGGAGIDTLIGGLGNDTYVLDNAAELDLVQELDGEGNDTLQITYANASATVAQNIDLSTRQHLENITLTGTGLFNLTGNTQNNVLKGNAQKNRIDGGLGADSMDGGAGDDTYIVDDLGDRISDSSGLDTVYSQVSYTLGTGLENLILRSFAAYGTGATLYGTGNTLANTLDGYSESWAVPLVLSGLGGNDTYIVASSDFTTVIESENGGIDLVKSYGDFILGDNVENLTLLGSSHALGHGNSLANIIIGNDGANELDGLAGRDLLSGGKGNDTYFVDLTSTNTMEDSVTENANEGSDTILLRGGNSALANFVTLTLGANFESLRAESTGSTKLNLTGNALDNLLIGNAADNILDGLAGADRMAGGSGNDTYVVDNLNDTIFEAGNEGTDLVKIAITTANGNYSLGDYLENATLINNVAFDLTGNALDNVLKGNALNNRIDGGLGADTMDGGAGNDTYIVDNLGDVISDSAGIDTVKASVSYTLSANLENLILTGSDAITGTGNALGNLLDGAQNSGANILYGLAGNDTYLVGADDSVVEAFNGGIDLVQAYVSFTLGDNVENLTLLAGAQDATGNALANVLTGNDGANRLYGGGGVDSLIGGKGNDTYVVDLIQSGIGSAATAALQDSFTEATGAGIDTLELQGVVNGLTKASTLTLAAALENLDASATGSTWLNLTGNTADNILTGNTAGNRLDGGAGNDHLYGGAGSDILIGGLGSDILSGGVDADTFLFNTLSELGLGGLRDIITDFDATQGDRIDLSMLDANLLLKGNNAFSFIGTADFSAAGQLRFVDQVLYGNINADLGADFEIQLLGVSTLDASSLVA